MQIAITGATGCLGQPLVEKLFAKGFSITYLIPQQDTVPILLRQGRAITGSVNDPEALHRLTKNCEVVFHLAGRVHSVPKTEAEEQDFFQINVEGTKKLLKVSKDNKVRRVVFYSTIGVYGQDANFHGDELSPCRPISVYAKSKYMAEKLVLNSSNDGGPEGVVLRFPVVYGPLDRGNVAKLIKSIYHKLFFYFDDGNCLRSMISSRNAAEAAIKAAFEPKAANELFCVIDGINYKLRDLIETICRSLNTNWRPFHMPVSIAKMTGRLGDLAEGLLKISCPINTAKVRKLSSSLTFSCDKAKQILGYAPVETLEEGIFREVEWLKKENGWK
jgi:nucleoside-diphosphate-sugar epimerase